MTCQSEKFQAANGISKEVQFQYKVQAPGRVNIIGEHVDYAKFPVLPMALAQTTDISFAFDENDGSEGLNVVLKSSNPEKYPTYSVEITQYLNKPEFECFEKPIKWHHYVLSGIIGVLEYKFDAKVLPTGTLYAFVSGSVPPAAGLSSSSSVVVAAALMAKTLVPKTDISNNELASICAQSEKYVGTVGGGMDQAISILGVKNSASLIEFHPALKATNVPLPDSAAVVVAHTGVEMNKAATTDFNERVLSTKYAAAMLTGGECYTLKETMEHKNYDFDACLADIHDTINSGTYVLKDLVNKYGPLPRVNNLPENAPLQIRNRAQHVIEESKRVCQFQSSTDLPTLGALMTASQTSLRELYECSHPALDEMCSKMVNFGAYGARLTGAGWGGCAIALVDKSSLDEFLKNLKAAYPDNLIFGTTPSDGARINKLVADEFGNKG